MLRARSLIDWMAAELPIRLDRTKRVPAAGETRALEAEIEGIKGNSPFRHSAAQGRFLAGPLADAGNVMNG